MVRAGLLTEVSAQGEKAVPQSATLTLVGALSFSRWREDKLPVFWVCCTIADNAGCQQSLIFPTVTNPSSGIFNCYFTTWFMLYPLRSVLLNIYFTKPTISSIWLKTVFLGRVIIDFTVALRSLIKVVKQRFCPVREVNPFLSGLSFRSSSDVTKVFLTCLYCQQWK